MNITAPTPPLVLVFAASDPTAGAGIQADLLTLASLGCHPLSVVTAITVQDTAGVDDVMAIDSDWVVDQARAVLEDIPVAAFKLGLVTSNPDDIDWADETRIAIEERVAMSPDALTGMEANLRFNGPENMFTRVFGRLTAWQNWIFQRPNAVGEKGALKVYGKGDKAQFDWNRV